MATNDRITYRNKQNAFPVGPQAYGTPQGYEQLPGVPSGPPPKPWGLPQAAIRQLPRPPMPTRDKNEIKPPQDGLAPVQATDVDQTENPFAF